MTSPTKRRPLPALVFLLALCVLAALVWWRVLNRDGSTASTSPSCSSTPTTVATQLPRPAAVTVRVLNSTDRDGIAGTTTTTLKADGFATLAADNDDKPDTYGSHGTIPGVAEIRYGPNGEAAAKLLSYYFPTATTVRRDGQDATILVALGTAFKSVAAPAAVNSAITADGLELAPTAVAGPTTGAAGC
jgi:hypothetical protein